MSCAFEDERGQAACRVTACIDTDAVGADLRLVGDGVPVNHRYPVIGFLVVQKLAANPAEIVRILLGQRGSGTNAGMNKQIIANLHLVLHSAKERDVLGGNGLPHAAGQIGTKAEDLTAADALAFQSLEAAIGQPAAKRFRIAIVDCNEGVLVIAHQEGVPLARQRPLSKHPHDTSAVRPAVHEIADKDQVNRTAVSGIIFLDPRKELLQFGKAAWISPMA